MRISDWSSDVCSSDLNFRQFRRKLPAMAPLRPIQIGNITIADPVILAPMTGVSDLPFRKLVRYYGSGLNVTEMIASQAAIRETRQSIQKAAWDRSEEHTSELQSLMRTQSDVFRSQKHTTTLT